MSQYQNLLAFNSGLRTSNPNAEDKNSSFFERDNSEQLHPHQAGANYSLTNAANMPIFPEEHNQRPLLTSFKSAMSKPSSFSSELLHQALVAKSNLGLCDGLTRSDALQSLRSYGSQSKHDSPRRMNQNFLSQSPTPEAGFHQPSASQTSSFLPNVHAETRNSQEIYIQSERYNQAERYNEVKHFKGDKCYNKDELYNQPVARNRGDSQHTQSDARNAPELGTGTFTSFKPMSQLNTVEDEDEFLYGDSNPVPDDPQESFERQEDITALKKSVGDWSDDEITIIETSNVPIESPTRKHDKQTTSIALKDLSWKNSMAWKDEANMNAKSLKQTNIESSVLSKRARELKFTTDKWSEDSVNPNTRGIESHGVVGYDKMLSQPASSMQSETANLDNSSTTTKFIPYSLNKNMSSSQQPEQLTSKEKISKYAAAAVLLRKQFNLNLNPNNTSAQIASQGGENTSEQRLQASSNFEKTINSTVLDRPSETSQLPQLLINVERGHNMSNKRIVSVTESSLPSSKTNVNSTTRTVSPLTIPLNIDKNSSFPLSLPSDQETTECQRRIVRDSSEHNRNKDVSQIIPLRYSSENIQKPDKYSKGVHDGKSSSRHWSPDRYASPNHSPRRRSPGGFRRRSPSPDYRHRDRSRSPGYRSRNRSRPRGPGTRGRQSRERSPSRRSRFHSRGRSPRHHSGERSRRDKSPNHKSEDHISRKRPHSPEVPTDIHSSVVGKRFAEGLMLQTKKSIEAQKIISKSSGIEVKGLSQKAEDGGLFPNSVSPDMAAMIMQGSGAASRPQVVSKGVDSAVALHDPYELQLSREYSDSLSNYTEEERLMSGLHFAINQVRQSDSLNELVASKVAMEDKEREIAKKTSVPTRNVRVESVSNAQTTTTIQLAYSEANVVTPSQSDMSTLSYSTVSTYPQQMVPTVPHQNVSMLPPQAVPPVLQTYAQPYSYGMPPYASNIPPPFPPMVEPHYSYNSMYPSPISPTATYNYPAPTMPLSTQSYDANNFDPILAATKRTTTSRSSCLRNVPVLPFTEKIPVLKHSAQEETSLIAKYKKHLEERDLIQKKLTNLSDCTVEMKKIKERFENQSKKVRTGSDKQFIADCESLQEKTSLELKRSIADARRLNEEVQALEKIIKPENLQKQELKPEPEQKKSSSETYGCFDTGKHWCVFCNLKCSSIVEMMQHLHTTDHLQHEDPLKSVTDKKPPKEEIRVTSLQPVKGVEFIKPLYSFYCSLCEESLLNPLYAEQHVKGHKHTVKYMNFLKENPFYEEKQRLIINARTAAAAKESRLKELAAISTAKQIILNKQKEKAERYRKEAEIHVKVKNMLQKQQELENPLEELDEVNTDIQESPKKGSKGIKMTLLTNEKEKAKSNEKPKQPVIYIGRAPNYKPRSVDKKAALMEKFTKSKEVMQPTKTAAVNIAKDKDNYKSDSSPSSSRDTSTHLSSNVPKVTQEVIDPHKSPSTRAPSNKSWDLNESSNAKKESTTVPKKQDRPSKKHITTGCQSEAEMKYTKDKHKAEVKPPQKKEFKIQLDLIEPKTDDPLVNQALKNILYGSKSTNSETEADLSAIKLPAIPSFVPPLPPDTEIILDKPKLELQPKKSLTEEEKDFLLLGINKSDMEPIAIPKPPPSNLRNIHTLYIPHSRNVSTLKVVQQVPPPNVQVPPPNVQVPPPNLQVPPPNIQVPPPNVQVPPPNMQVPPPNMQVPPLNVQIPPPNIQVPPPNLQVPPPNMQVPPPNVQVPPPNVQVPPPNVQSCFILPKPSLLLTPFSYQGIPINKAIPHERHIAFNPTSCPPPQMDTSSEVVDMEIDYDVAVSKIQVTSDIPNLKQIKIKNSSDGLVEKKPELSVSKVSSEESIPVCESDLPCSNVEKLLDVKHKSDRNILPKILSEPSLKESCNTSNDVCSHVVEDLITTVESNRDRLLCADVLKCIINSVCLAQFTTVSDTSSDDIIKSNLSNIKIDSSTHFIKSTLSVSSDLGSTVSIAQTNSMSEAVFHESKSPTEEKNSVSVASIAEIKENESVISSSSDINFSISVPVNVLKQDFSKETTDYKDDVKITTEDSIKVMTYNEEQACGNIDESTNTNEFISESNSENMNNEKDILLLGHFMDSPSVMEKSGVKIVSNIGSLPSEINNAEQRRVLSDFNSECSISSTDNSIHTCAEKFSTDLSQSSQNTEELIFQSESQNKICCLTQSPKIDTQNVVLGEVFAEESPVSMLQVAEVVASNAVNKEEFCADSVEALMDFQSESQDNSIQSSKIDTTKSAKLAVSERSSSLVSQLQVMEVDNFIADKGEDTASVDLVKGLRNSEASMLCDSELQGNLCLDQSPDSEVIVSINSTSIMQSTEVMNISAEDREETSINLVSEDPLLLKSAVSKDTNADLELCMDNPSLTRESGDETVSDFGNLQASAKNNVEQNRVLSVFNPECSVFTDHTSVHTFEGESSTDLSLNSQSTKESIPQSESLNKECVLGQSSGVDIQKVVPENIFAEERAVNSLPVADVVASTTVNREGTFVGSVEGMLDFQNEPQGESRESLKINTQDAESDICAVSERSSSLVSHLQDMEVKDLSAGKKEDIAFVDLVKISHNSEVSVLSDSVPQDNLCLDQHTDCEAVVNIHRESQNNTCCLDQSPKIDAQKVVLGGVFAEESSVSLLQVVASSAVNKEEFFADSVEALMDFQSGSQDNSIQSSKSDTTKSEKLAVSEGSSCLSSQLHVMEVDNFIADKGEDTASVDLVKGLHNSEASMLCDSEDNLCLDQSPDSEAVVNINSTSLSHDAEVMLISADVREETSGDLVQISQNPVSADSEETATDLENSVSVTLQQNTNTMGISTDRLEEKQSVLQETDISLQDESSCILSVLNTEENLQICSVDTTILKINENNLMDCDSFSESCFPDIKSSLSSSDVEQESSNSSLVLNIKNTGSIIQDAFLKQLDQPVEGNLELQKALSEVNVNNILSKSKSPGESLEEMSTLKTSKLPPSLAEVPDCLIEQLSRDCCDIKDSGLLLNVLEKDGQCPREVEFIEKYEKEVENATDQDKPIIKESPDERYAGITEDKLQSQGEHGNLKETIQSIKVENYLKTEITEKDMAESIQQSQKQDHTDLTKIEINQEGDIQVGIPQQDHLLTHLYIDSSDLKKSALLSGTQLPALELMQKVEVLPPTELLKLDILEDSVSRVDSVINATVPSLEKFDLEDSLSNSISDDPPVLSEVSGEKVSALEECFDQITTGTDDPKVEEHSQVVETSKLEANTELLASNEKSKGLCQGQEKKRDSDTDEYETADGK